MIALGCGHEEFKKHGKDRNGNQRFRCKTCGKSWIEERSKPIGDMRIDLDRAITSLNLLLEGMSVRAVERVTGLKRDTICDLVLIVGQNCEKFLRSAVKDVAVDDVQVDELWAFVGCKARTKQRLNRTDDCGDSWTYIAIERNTKLILAHHVGDRNGEHATEFLRKLRKATSGRFQLTSDGFGGYTYNVPFTFGRDVDYGRLVKQYQSSQAETRYSPASIISAERTASFGNPDPEKICTSHVERANLTLRMQVRRFTRLTNAHSKSMDHHKAMQAIFFAHYNYCRKHTTVKQTPAQAAKLTQMQWSIGELLHAAAH